MVEKISSSEDVIDLYSKSENLGIKFWIDGGWAVDALLGTQTRPHTDLDVAIEQKDAQRFREFLEQQGYKEVRRDNQWNYVLGDEKGREVDIHVFIFDGQGNVVDGIKYPAASLAGSGIINGHTVRCISAEYLVKFLAPWLSKHPDKYPTAIKSLCDKFGIAYPEEYLALTRKSGKVVE